MHSDVIRYEDPATTSLLQNRAGEKVVVEAAHVYADETDWSGQIDGARIGAEIAKEIGQSGALVRKMLFVDDFHPTKKLLDLEAFLSEIRGVGFNPDEIVYESGLVEDADEIAEEMARLNLAKKRENGSIEFKHINGATHRIGLKKKDGKPTCTALDAALYLRKLHEHDQAVTVLPKSWEPQQEHTKGVLDLVGNVKGIRGSVRQRIKNIYF